MLHNLLHDYGLPAVFVLLALESCGLPLPGETVMVAAAIYAARTGNLGVVPLLATACAGAAAGGFAGYFIGSGFGAPLLDRFGPRIGFNADRRLLAEYLMRHDGAALVVGGRFVAVLRSLASVLAGANRMPMLRFAIANIGGAALWTGLFCIGPFVLGRTVLDLAGRASLILAPVVVLLLVAGFVFLRRNEERLVGRARAEQQVLAARKAAETSNL